MNKMTHVKLPNCFFQAQRAIDSYSRQLRAGTARYTPVIQEIERRMLDAQKRFAPSLPVVKLIEHQNCLASNLFAPSSAIVREFKYHKKHYKQFNARKEVSWAPTTYVAVRNTALDNVPPPVVPLFTLKLVDGKLIIIIESPDTDKCGSDETHGK